MKREFMELYGSFCDKAGVLNSRILSELKNKKKRFASEKTLSLWVSECLMEDIDMVQQLKDGGFSNRYVDAIIRNMCEQVIEYLYVMKHKSLIRVYFGENIRAGYNQQGELLSALKQTGQARFGKRESVKNMADNIGELVSGDKISLYDIFSIKAELEHNSYFHHIFDIIGQIEGEERVEDDIDYLFMTFILTAFLDVYCTV